MSKELLIVVTLLIASSYGGNMLDPALRSVPNTGSLWDKFIVGYEANQNVPGDGINLDWRNWGTTLSVATPMFPYVDPTLYPNAKLSTLPPSWNLPTLGTGATGHLYSGVDPWVTDAHIKMMAVSGVHVVTVERFLSEVCTMCDPRTIKHRNTVLANVANATAKYGRLFLVEYDLSGMEQTNPFPQPGVDWYQQLTNDFSTNVLPYSTKSNYATHNSRPVVWLWKGPHQIDHDKLKNAVSYIQSKGFDVVIGVNWDWRSTDSAYFDIYKVVTAVNPWCMGSSVQDVETNVRTQAQGDAAWAHSNGIDLVFLLCSGPSYNRVSATQVVNVTNGLNNMYHYQHVIILSELRHTYSTTTTSIGGYLCMFDDYGEAEVLAPLAATLSQLPGGKSYWQYLSEETGALRSPDYNLRMTRANIQMLHNGTYPLPANIPIVFNTYTLPQLMAAW